MTKKERLLDWVTRSGPLLESQVIGSGMSAALNDLIMERKLTMIAHPTVRDRGGAPAAAVALLTPENTP